MLSGIGQSDGLVDRLLAATDGSDAAWLAGIAVVVGIMLWAAGARAVSLAFAAAGGTAGLFAAFWLSQRVQIPDIAGLPGSIVAGAVGAAVGVVIALVAMRLVVAAASGATAAAAAAGLAVLFAPHLPEGIIGAPSTAPPTASVPAPVVQPVAWPDTPNSMSDEVAPSDAGEQPQEPDTPAGLTTEVVTEKASAAWQRVPETVQGEAALVILACGLGGAMLGAIWPARIASATTAFLGAAIWPIGAMHMQSLAGTPLPIEQVPTTTWLIAWLVLGIVGLGIQRLVVRRVAEG